MLFSSNCGKENVHAIILILNWPLLEVTLKLSDIVNQLRLAVWTGQAVQDSTAESAVSTTAGKLPR